ncbi:MAG TPA: hypothetical protein PKA06_03035 [Gemmatales bacterium]|nr:hypothetical protein [Gemmatales bacterium]
MFSLLTSSRDFTADDAARLRRIEQKLDLLLKHFQIQNTLDSQELPGQAQTYADTGQVIQAIKAYREATGAGLSEAKAAIDSYLTRRKQK